jgi:hypothetical protein
MDITAELELICGKGVIKKMNSIYRNSTNPTPTIDGNQKLKCDRVYIVLENRNSTRNQKNKIERKKKNRSKTYTRTYTNQPSPTTSNQTQTNCQPIQFQVKAL